MFCPWPAGSFFTHSPSCETRREHCGGTAIILVPLQASNVAIPDH